MDNLFLSFQFGNMFFFRLWLILIGMVSNVKVYVCNV